MEQIVRLGIAYTGQSGNKNAFIALLYLDPIQLIINKVIAVGPKLKSKDFYPEIALFRKTINNHKALHNGFFQINQLDAIN